MRTRTRSLYRSPSASSDLPCDEIFVDDTRYPKSRGWKEASHQTRKVLGATKYGVKAITTVSQGSITYGPYMYPAYAPMTTLDMGLTGPFEATLPSDISVPLPQLDLVAEAMERSRSSFFMLDFMRTWDQTAKMFKKLHDVAKRFKHLGMYNGFPSDTPLRKFHRAIDRAGSTWLEGTYGYIPFLQDLAEFHRICSGPKKVLAEAMNLPLVSTHKQDSFRIFDGVNPDDGSPRWKNTVIFDVQCIVRRKRVVETSWALNPSFAAMSMTAQLATFMGCLDLGRGIWEAIPGSFIVDWFTNAGSRIANDPALNGPLMWLVSDESWIAEKTVTTVTRYGARINRQEPSGPWQTRMVTASGNSVSEITDFSRNVVPTSSLTGIFAVNGASAMHTTTGLALALGNLPSLTARLK